MAINTSLGGIQKPVEKSRGVLWWAEAGAVDVDAITATADLAGLGLNEAGGITTDGITLSANAEDPETFPDFNGNIFDSTEATSKQSFTVSLLEVLNENAAKLVFANGAVTAGADNVVTSIRGSGNPSNKLFVIDTRIKNTRVRVILPECSFASRGDDSYNNTALYAWNVTYNVLTGTNGEDVIRLFSPITA